MKLASEWSAPAVSSPLGGIESRKMPRLRSGGYRIEAGTGAPLAYREERPYTLGNREEPVSRPSDLVQGTLDLLILKIVALEPSNGWAISQRLKDLSSDVLQVSDGSLYPALHKLEQEGWITAEWKASENNRRAKFYSLTRAGRKQLRLEIGNWDRLAAAITTVARLQET